MRWTYSGSVVTAITVAALQKNWPRMPVAILKLCHQIGIERYACNTLLTATTTTAAAAAAITVLAVLLLIYNLKLKSMYKFLC